jgi:hypothetical protein
MSKLDRRGLLRSAFLTSIAAMAPMEALAAMPGNVPSGTSSKALSELAEARRLIAALIRIDGRISAAEQGRDARRAEKLEGNHRRVYRKLQKLRTALESEPPRCWLDIVIRAEIAGYMLVWDKPRTNWQAMLDKVANNPSAGDPGMDELAVAVLYLAARGAEQPDMRAG